MRCTTGSFYNNTFKLVTGWAPGVNPGCSGILRRYIFRENYDLGVRISRSIFFYCLNLASRAQFRQYRVSWPSCGPDQHTAVLVWPTGLPAIVRRADWVGGTHGPARATTLASRECQAVQPVVWLSQGPAQTSWVVQSNDTLPFSSPTKPCDHRTRWTPARAAGRQHQTRVHVKKFAYVSVGKLTGFWFGRWSANLVTDQKRGAKVLRWPMSYADQTKNCQFAH